MLLRETNRLASLDNSVVLTYETVLPINNRENGALPHSGIRVRRITS